MQKEKKENDSHCTTHPRVWGVSISFGLAAALLFLGLQSLKLPEIVLDGKIYFLDPDSYTWVDRAKQVLEEPGIYVHEDPLDNYPHGYVPHWTQPFHWVLAFSALFFSNVERAGIWICPILGALTTLLFGAWAARRWPWPVAILTMAVFLLNPFELWTFSLGRPDHQGLLMFCLLPAVLLLIDRGETTEHGKARLITSALFTAAGLWVSVQALSIWALLLGVLGLRAALAPRANRKILLSDAFTWAVAAACGGLAGFLLEGRPDPFALITDSISMGHAVLMTLPAAGLFITRQALRARHHLTRPVWFLVTSAPAVLLTLGGAAWLWLGQMGADDPALLAAMSRWFSQNAEFLPAIFTVNGEPAFGRLHTSLAFTLYVFPLLLFALTKTTHVGHRGRWILGLGLLIGSLLTLWQMRWRDVHALFIAPVLALALWQWFFTRMRTSTACFIAALASLAILFPWLQIAWKSTVEDLQPSAEYRALRQISEWIRENDPYQEMEDHPTALAVWDQGPLVKYWSGRPVVAGPYHRNMEGITDTMRAFTARTPAEFDAIAGERRIRYLIRPPLGDQHYDLYTFEWIPAKANPAIYIWTQQLTADGKGVMRGYDLNPGMTPTSVERILRLRLESGDLSGWPRLKPIQIPGLDRLLPDAAVIPYLYRYEIPP